MQFLLKSSKTQLQNQLSEYRLPCKVPTPISEMSTYLLTLLTRLLCYFKFVGYKTLKMLVFDMHLSTLHIKQETSFLLLIQDKEIAVNCENYKKYRHAVWAHCNIS
jgi:hypothetical protein